MINKTIVVTVALVIGLAGCASEYKTEAKEETAAKKEATAPVNCKTAEGDLRMLNNEKASTANRIATRGSIGVRMWGMVRVAA